MDLLILQGTRVWPSVHALMIEPFKTIWELDEDVHKVNAIKLFSYVELVCSPKKSNPFYSTPANKRAIKVKKEVYNDEHYHTTMYMMSATEKYKECLAESALTYPLLEASMMARDALIENMASLNLKATNDHGTLLLKPKDITGSLKEISIVSETLEKLRNKVDQELTDAAKTRNEREIGMYEE